MFVKGTAFLARKAMITGRFGDEAWASFFSEFQATHPAFQQPVLAVSQLKHEDFLAFVDAVMERFYSDNPGIHWEIGHAAAEWAFADGPYKAFFQSRDIDRFLLAARSLYRSYYSEGDFKTARRPGSKIVDATLTDIPTQHPHFELTIMGYVDRCFELVGIPVERHEVLKGYGQGDDQVHYVFYLAEVPDQLGESREGPR